MCKILKVSSLLGLLAFCAAEGMQINASSEENPEARGNQEISGSPIVEINEEGLEPTDLNDGMIKFYQKDEISEQIDNCLVGELKFNDGRVEYFTGRNIPENWFKGNTSLESIVIPPTVTSIGCNAFYECLQLKEVIFTEGSQLQIIGGGAFSKCRQLKEVIFTEDSQLQEIEDYAFWSSGINTVTIPNSVKTIGYGAFLACDQLQEVIFPEGSKLQKIGECAFFETAIKEITIPNSVTVIKSWAFEGGLQLKEVIFPEGSQLQIIEIAAFSGTAIKEITIPGTVQKIRSCAFDGCKQLSKVVFLGDPSKMIIYRDAFPENVKRVYSNDSKE